MERVGAQLCIAGIGFEYVVAAAWRTKLALRGEQAELRKQLEVESEEKRNRPIDDGSRMTYPYSLKAWELRRRLKVLEEVRNIVEKHTLISPEWEKPVTQAFGADFWRTLVEWTPTEPLLLHMLRIGLVRSRAYGLKLPQEPPTPEEEKEYVAADALARRQMMLKLVDVEKQHLQLALRHVQQTEDAGAVLSDKADRLDLFIRYQTTARREFYRALKEY